jgi:hypothetical protein
MTILSEFALAPTIGSGESSHFRFIRFSNSFKVSSLLYFIGAGSSFQVRDASVHELVSPRVTVSPRIYHFS